MVRFLCFNAPIHSHKPKKTAQRSVDVMRRAAKEYAKVQSPNDRSNSFVSERGEVTQNSSDVKHVECHWKIQETNGVGSHLTGCLRKTHSVDNIFLTDGREATENETTKGLKNQRYSCDNSHLQVGSSSGVKNAGENLPSQLQKVVYSESIQVSSDVVNNKSIFSIGDSYNSEIEGHENSDSQESGDCGGKSESYSPLAPSKIVKSSSLPITVASAGCDGGYSPLLYPVSQSRSSEELQIIDMKQKDLSIDEIQKQEMGEEQKGSTKSNTENNSNYDHNESHIYSRKDWIMPVMDEGSTVRSIQEEISVHQGNELSSNEFKIKRIEEWVDSIQNSGPMEETSELLYAENETTKVGDVLNGLITAKADTKVSPGVEAAEIYFSTLSATASSAQLSNHGLLSIPLLSAFASLRVLNLSGNAIVRITAGALPRGLHVLNLSKNNISTIEGLRELTRLRVLDLSFNRIIRIGHGLAYCSSLKELYLAGNKISEVDGLHRLLKLIVLDLRFNKISTTKCLDHIAANYNSLQAISLEGNPAQRNVGDEQLKKHLQGLLPHLAYYNRQPIKVGSLKDAADRSVRLVTANQVDRGIRSDHKTTRKTNSSLPSHKLSSQRNHSAVSPTRQSRGKRAPVPPPLGSDQRHYYGYASRQLNLKPDILMPRSRSEGRLGAF